MKTIKRHKLNPIAMLINKKPEVVIDNDSKKRYVGSEWVDEGKATEVDKETYPKVVD